MVSNLSSTPTPGINTDKIHEFQLKLLSIDYTSNHSDHSGTRFLHSNPRIDTFFNVKEALIFHLSCTKFQTQTLRQASLTVICRVIVEPTDFTKIATVVLCSMIEETTNLTRDPIGLRPRSTGIMVWTK